MAAFFDKLNKRPHKCFLWGLLSFLQQSIAFSFDNSRTKKDKIMKETCKKRTSL